MIYTRLLAAFYKQPPDFFDDWPALRVEYEMLIMNEITDAGLGPATRRDLLDSMLGRL